MTSALPADEDVPCSYEYLLVTVAMRCGELCSVEGEKSNVKQERSVCLGGGSSQVVVLEVGV